MIYKFIAILNLLCIIISTGCTQAFTPAKECQQPSPRLPIQIGQKAEVVPLTASPLVKAGIDPQKVHGDIQNIFYTRNTTVIIDADKVYLYDLSTGEVLAETSKESFNQPRYQTCGKGYAAIGDLQGSLNGKVVFYSNTLEKESELSFSQITGSQEPIFSNSFAVSPNGGKIAYADGKGITIFDVAAKSRTRILNLEYGAPSSARAGIMHIEQLLFTSDGRSLILLSGVENGNAQSIAACGKINVDGTGLINQPIPGFIPYEIAGCYGSFALFGEDDRYRSGRMVLLEAATGSPKFLPLATQREQAAFGSDNGAYYATGALGESGCTVRIYATATGKQIFEQFIPHGGNPLYISRNPVIRILEQSKTCIVLMGNRQDDVKTKVTFLNF